MGGAARWRALETMYPATSANMLMPMMPTTRTVMAVACGLALSRVKKMESTSSGERSFIAASMFSSSSSFTSSTNSSVASAAAASAPASVSVSAAAASAGASSSAGATAASSAPSSADAAAASSSAKCTDFFTAEEKLSPPKENDGSCASSTSADSRPLARMLDRSAPGAGRVGDCENAGTGAPAASAPNSKDWLTATLDLGGKETWPWRKALAGRSASSPAPTPVP
mmetsp:Transcript_1632/g.5966  ORF Transcript_1632/g.5966 Transcript_1632/m.5966 type:complete len:227 (+) Transcript_1632:3216-3896(+)